MLRHLLCLAAFLPAILSQGESLESFEDLVAALRAGHRVQANFNRDFCEESNYPSQRVVSVQFSRWQYTEVELQVPAVVAVQPPIMIDGWFSLIFSYVDADGLAILEEYTISAETGAVVSNNFMSCTTGVGTFFLEKGNRQPDTALTSYDEVMAALTEGRQLTLTAKVTDCEHPLPPEVILAEGGTTSYQWVVPPDETGEAFLAVEWPGLSLSAVEGQTVYTVSRVLLSKDGSVFVAGNYFNTLTWEDEYPYPQGFQCVLGESIDFHYASGDTYDSYATSAEVDAALLAGKDLQAAVDVTACTSPNGTLSPLLYAGAKVTGWLREETGEMPGIFFYESIADLAGIMTVFEFHVADDDVLHVRGTTFDPLDPGVVLAEEILQCRLGGAARFYAAAYDRVELMDYESVVEAQTRGGKLAVQIDFGGCVDWTGGVNLTGVMTGAYLHDLFDFVPEGMTTALLGSAHALKSDPASGVAYESFDVFVFESGNPMVIPGYWRIDESGDWGNDFGAAFMDCPIGRGVRIFQEV